jgi:VWFA-related protein
MRVAWWLVFVSILAVLPTTPAVCQTSTREQVMTVTLYSPLKYKVTNASSLPSGSARPDFSRAYFDFTIGNLRAFGRWDLSYGTISNSHGADWFLVRIGDDEQSVLRDLGKIGWNDRFQIPIIPPLPELKPGEHRNLTINNHPRDSVRGLPSEIRGAPSAGDQDIGVPSRDPDAGPTLPPPLGSIPQLGPKNSKKSKSDPVVAKTVLGHMYVIHILDAQSDFYVLVHVDGLVPGDNCTISWRRLARSTPANSPSTTRPVVTSGGSVAALNSQGPASTPTQQKSTTVAETSTDEKPPVLISETSIAAKVSAKPTLKAFGASLDQLKWDPERQAAVEITNARDKGEGESSKDLVRIETRLVVSNVLVLDRKGLAVEGLTQDDFIVTEDGQPQQISDFALGHDADVGRSIVLILDYSSSLAPYIDLSVAAAKSLVDQLGPKDRMAIVTDDVELLVDFTRDKSQLEDGLDSLAKKATADRFGKSAQFSALLAAIRELFSVEDIRPIVIFQTDGDQIGFMQPVDHDLAQNPTIREKIVQFSLNDVNSLVANSRRITIYTVLPGLRLMGLPLSQQARRADIIVQNDVLTAHRRALKSNPNLPPPPPFSVPPQVSAGNAANRLKMQQAAAGVAEITGGESFFLEQPEQAGDIYSQILSDVNRRYVIGYYPTNKTSDGKRRRVVIEVRNHPEYTVEGRKSYIATVAP